MRWPIVIAAVLIAAAALALLNDESQQLCRSWLEGNPKALVKISVSVPPGDECFVAVHRFPTDYNPTEKGRSKVVYRGVVPCGSTIVVRDELRMLQVGVKESWNDVKPVYASPEYAVIVASKDGSFVRIVHPLVTRPITEVRVSARFERNADLEASGKLCRMEDIPACVVAVNLTYLNSIPGLRVGFGLEARNAIYFESWGSACVSQSDDGCPQEFWHPAGAKLAESDVSEVSYVSNGVRALVSALVEYAYERHAYRHGDRYWNYELLYPTTIGGIRVTPIGSYVPQQPPKYAAGPKIGNVSIWFPTEFEGFRRLNMTTNFTLEIGSTRIALSVSPYAGYPVHWLGRSTPYVDVIDVGGVAYHFWYKDDDPANYEVGFAGGESSG